MHLIASQSEFAACILGKLTYLLAAVAAVPVVVCVLHGNYNYHWQVQLISTPGINRSN